MGDCPEQYLEFNNTTEENYKTYTTDTVTRVLVGDKYLYPWDEKFRVEGSIGTGGGTHNVPDCYTQEETPYTKIFATFEEYMKEWCGEKPVEVPSDGKKRKFSFDETKPVFGYWQNPNAKWDWYLLGGRWTGFFKLKSGAKGAVGEGGVFSNTPKDGWVDSARKGDIDFKGMAEVSGKEGGIRWDKVHKLVGKSIDTYVSWTKVREEMFKDKMNEARDFYNNQEAVKLLHKDREFGIWIDLDEYTVTREEYVKDCENSSVGTFAVLLDGKWYEKGEMGWWGCVSNKKSDWNAEFAKLLESISDDTVLSVYDCHI
jgi:hypothetical protein